ncbi:hypothetical protein KFK09_002722 [Dendrobium nobile]|uniref:non-specific serine/threonine protein kinase n=1 Tax=Dendrobium nobile TaxID=94219 RepID=A0A8T3C2G0_DENNO|nr:hypothetical protein KFK09_002722 [Dendrobium nobile]
MFDQLPDSDGDIGYEMLNSSQSSSSNSCERCSSFSSCLSFEASGPAPPPPDFRSKPHRSSDRAWTAIRSRAGSEIGPRDFRLLRRIGSGDISTVYLCRLRDDHSASSLYAMKVVDRLSLARKKKLGRADTERRILRELDHPFLPILYADFDASPHYSCVVMEYCSGGNLHSLLHRMPGGRFSVSAARFYAAEVLLALEYLHMLGIIYRDLKPENILIKSDGHIMLSDFDLSLHSSASPALETVKPTSCFLGRLLRSKKTAPGRLFVAEPLGARSNSFVGTHEYVSPEVAAGRAHGSAVDWYAFGIFLYELLYGRTPFVGPTNDATLRNILNKPLAFPRPAGGEADGADEAAAKDLIAGLLVKDPAGRLGSRRGAAEIKVCRFFKGVNFGLIRSCQPPVLPGFRRAASCREASRLDRFEGF